MKAVFALIIIYVGTFLIAIQGASNSPVEASEQTAARAKSIDPLKEADIRSLLELVGAKDSLEDAANAATEQYRQRLLDANVSSDRAQAFTNAYLTEFQKKFDTDSVNQKLVGIYDQHFAAEEIRGLLEFYGSPLGQKVAAEMPKVNREIQLALRSASNQAARQTWQQLRAENSKGSENPHPFLNRRRPNANPAAEVEQQPAAQQAQADSSQP